MAQHDPHSYADDAQPCVTSFDLDADVDFDRRVLECVVLLALGDARGGRLDLDTRGLTIRAVTTGEKKPVPFTVHPDEPVRGARLSLELPPGCVEVRITYSTSPTTACQSGSYNDRDDLVFAVVAGTTYSISGTVSGAVASGVTMTLSGAGTGSTTTATDGTYTFSGLANGTYTVTPTKTGYTFSPTSTSVTIAGANQTGKNFTATAVTTYSISGTISGAVSVGVTMTLTGAGTGTTATTTGGTYTFSGLANGTYTVTPSLSGYTFSPTSSSNTISGANITGVNFTSTASAATTLFTNGFESSTGWAQTDTSGTAGTWSLVTSGTYPTCSVHGGSYMAMFNSYTSANGSATRYYRTSGFAVAGTYTTVTLKFYMYHDTGYSTDADSVQVQVSTNGTTWTSVGSAINRYSATNGWVQASIDLSAYKGQTVYLGFLGTSKYGDNIYLDDVTVVGQ